MCGRTLSCTRVTITEEISPHEQKLTGHLGVDCNRVSILKKFLPPPFSPLGPSIYSNLCTSNILGKSNTPSPTIQLFATHSAICSYDCSPFNPSPSLPKGKQPVLQTPLGVVVFRAKPRHSVIVSSAASCPLVRYSSQTHATA